MTLHRKNTPYKYSLHSKLLKMSHPDYVLAMNFLPEFLKVNKKTFRNWIYIKQDQGWEIPSFAIIKLAIFFECTPADLITDKKEEFDLNKAWEKFRSKFDSPEELIKSIDHVQD